MIRKYPRYHGKADISQAWEKLTENIATCAHLNRNILGMHLPNRPDMPLPPSTTENFMNPLFIFMAF